MSKQLEGLCHHVDEDGYGRLTTAFCPDCAIEADLYQPNKKIDWNDADDLIDKAMEKHHEALTQLPDITAQSILQEAIDCISDRAPFRDANGEKSIELAAEVFNKLTAHDLTEYDACIFMACIKLARSQRGQFHRDDYVDAAAYLSLAGESRAGQVRPKGRRPEVREYLSQGSPARWDRSESNVPE